MAVINNADILPFHRQIRRKLITTVKKPYKKY